MTNKEKYTPEEWRLLQETLSLSGLLVMITSPSPQFGRAASLFKETNALYTSLTQMLSHGAAYPLIDELRLELRDHLPYQREDEPDNAFLRDATPDQARKIILDRLRQTAQLLHQKAEADEIAFYKKGLLWVCAQVASAVHEGGGLLGAPQPSINEEERQAIRQIAFALGLPAAESLVAGLPKAPRRILPTQLASFINEEEWQILREAPIRVSSAILSASPSGVIGTLREVATLIRALRSAHASSPDNRLIDAVMDDLGLLAVVGGETPFLFESNLAPQQALDKALTACHQVSRLLRTKALDNPGEDGARVQNEGLEFKQMLIDMARQVAETSREGGFLGIGGKRISAAEQGLLDAVAGALEL
jgi:hypothetical protein